MRVFMATALLVVAVQTGAAETRLNPFKCVRTTDDSTYVELRRNGTGVFSDGYAITEAIAVEYEIGTYRFILTEDRVVQIVLTRDRAGQWELGQHEREGSNQNDRATIQWEGYCKMVKK